jgi:Family of unknown function (DUF6088)
MEFVREKILTSGERYWRHSDFAELSSAAVAQALSRLTREGIIQRISKGVYYRSRPTSFGPSRPSENALRELSTAQSKHKAVFPAGLAAANRLGLSTQNPARIVLATPATSVSRLGLPKRTQIQTRRPAAWSMLEVDDAALLDVLRTRGAWSELESEATAYRLLALLRENGRYERLLPIVLTEPTRVRAIFGAIGQELNKSKKLLESLREGLAPSSRYDFGALSVFKYAKEWQAK